MTTSALSAVALTGTPKASGCVVANDTCFSYTTESNEAGALTRSCPSAAITIATRYRLTFNMMGTIPTFRMKYISKTFVRYWKCVNNARPPAHVGVARRVRRSAAYLRVGGRAGVVKPNRSEVELVRTGCLGSVFLDVFEFSLGHDGPCGPQARAIESDPVTLIPR
jgi:hypothetical protein